MKGFDGVAKADAVGLHLDPRQGNDKNPRRHRYGELDVNSPADG